MAVLSHWTWLAGLRSGKSDSTSWMAEAGQDKQAALLRECSS